MTGPFIVIGIIILIVIIFILSGLKVVSQSETKVIERLGKFHKVLPSGLNIIWPILDKPRAVYVRDTKAFTRDGRSLNLYAKQDSIDLREQLIDFPPQDVITKDNVRTEINAILYYQIVDPIKATYEIVNLPEAIVKLTQTTLRNVIGELEFDETLTSRDTINSKLRDVLDDATNKWGVKVNRVEVQDITPPASVKDAMEQQMQAEREKRAKVLRAQGEKEAAILQSEGEKASRINQAEADKQTKILKAQGEAEAKIVAAKAEAEAIAKVTEAIGKTDISPANYMIAEKYIAALKEMVTGKDNKTIYMPYDASSLLSSIGSIKDMFQK
ncbi:MAG: SPFH/Band 7/PHB domain protein [Bacteroidales bacterium]|nr:SPFH/Band 7/PHB domain protein [Candidatus Cryptobacteroides aphodequi]